MRRLLLLIIIYQYNYFQKDKNFKYYEKFYEI